MQFSFAIDVHVVSCVVLDRSFELVILVSPARQVFWGKIASAGATSRLKGALIYRVLYVSIVIFYCVVVRV